jgi:hypothetical protein
METALEKLAATHLGVEKRRDGFWISARRDLRNSPGLLLAGVCNNHDQTSERRPGQRPTAAAATFAL